MTLSNSPEEPLELKTEADVVSLMEGSNSEQEWNENCDRVQAAFGGYPPFWFKAIIKSGLGQRKRNEWNK